MWEGDPAQQGGKIRGRCPDCRALGPWRCPMSQLASRRKAKVCEIPGIRMIETNRSYFRSRRNHLPARVNDLDTVADPTSTGTKAGGRKRVAVQASVSVPDGKAHLAFFLQNPSPTGGRGTADTSGGRNDWSGAADRTATTACRVPPRPGLQPQLSAQRCSPKFIYKFRIKEWQASGCVNTSQRRGISSVS